MNTYFDFKYWKEQAKMSDVPPDEYYTQILPRFPAADFNAGVVITLNGTIHHRYYLRTDYLIHELVHVKQQIESGLTAQEWLDRYFEDEEFRLQIELEAFGTQHKWIEKNYPRNSHHNFYLESAKNLCSELYQFKNMDILKAISLIKQSGHYVK